MRRDKVGRPLKRKPPAPELKVRDRLRKVHDPAKAADLAEAILLAQAQTLADKENDNGHAKDAHIADPKMKSGSSRKATQKPAPQALKPEGVRKTSAREELRRARDRRGGARGRGPADAARLPVVSRGLEGAGKEQSDGEIKTGKSST
jgi:hypothetical protein